MNAMLTCALFLSFRCPTIWRSWNTLRRTQWDCREGGTTTPGRTE